MGGMEGGRREMDRGCLPSLGGVWFMLLVCEVVVVGLAVVGSVM